MKKLFLILSFFIIGIAAIIFFAWREAEHFLNTPASEKSAEILFNVAAGSRMEQIAKKLEEAGLVSSARKFSILAWMQGQDRKLKAGRFLLNRNWKPGQILTALVDGRPALDRITIPEGLTWWQTGKLLADNGFVRFDDFRDAIHDPAFLRHYGIPFNSAEGFLMPDTYLLKKPLPDNPDESNSEKEFDWKSQSRKIAGRLVDNFWIKSASVWPAVKGSVKKRPSETDLKKWVILASIVEKETAIPEERPKVAGVYQNRLDKNMLLQADPTIIYGLGSDFSGPLLRRHIEDESNAYNTYRHAGLTPGPIASFGISALKAAVRPEQHKYLYFVAKTDGGAHNFSETLADHNEAVRQYRKQK